MVLSLQSMLSRSGRLLFILWMLLHTCECQTPVPSRLPTLRPTLRPTAVPTATPTSLPSSAPTSVPSSSPSSPPTPLNDAVLFVDPPLLNEIASVQVTIALSSEIDSSMEIRIGLPGSQRIMTDDISTAISNQLLVSPSNVVTAEWHQGDYDPEKPFQDSAVYVRVISTVQSNTSLTIWLPDENGLSLFCGWPSSAEYFTEELGVPNSLQSFAAVPTLSYRFLEYTSSGGVGSFGEWTHPKPFSSFAQLGNGCSHLNDCSGHGTCDYCRGTCVCDAGYGAASDLVVLGRDVSNSCKSRICPSGRAVADLPISTNEAHQIAECSNRGKCNRDTGVCECHPPFSGASCNTMTCPTSVPGEECSGHGVCWNMAEIAAEGTPSIIYGSNSTMRATKAWDYNMMRGCLCNSSWPVGYGADQYQLSEYFGADCSSKRCPSGNNPYTCEDEEDCFGKSQINGVLKGALNNKCHVECSNRGFCDRSTGVCTCFLGSNGTACEKLAQGIEEPACRPTVRPTFAPTVQFRPTGQPTTIPSSEPTSMPSQILYLPSNFTGCALIPGRTTMHETAVNCSLFVDTFDHKAVVYCAGYEVGSNVPVPARPEDIILHQNGALSFEGAVSVNITNLIASTTYNIYCASVSMAGILSPIEEVMYTLVPGVTTSCCRDVQTVVDTIPLIEGMFRFDGVSVFLPALPHRVLHVTLAAYHLDTNLPTPNITFNPPTVSFDSKSLSLSKAFDIISTVGSVGKYWVNATISGTSDDEYVVAYLHSHILEVVNSSAIPPVPQMLRAVFANNGASLTVKFDSDTDQAKISGRFDCSLLFFFFSNTKVTSSVCQWLDPSSVAIYVSDGLIPGSNITLANGKLRAKCTSGPVIPCANWTTTTASIIARTATSPVKPVVVVSGPETLNKCFNLTIDLTSSVGAAGRNWYGRPVFSLVTTTAKETSALMTYLNNDYIMNPPSEVRNSLLEGGAKYTLEVKLCNFLLACSKATYFFQVSSSEKLPYVSIEGPPNRFMRAADILTLNGYGAVISCSGVKRTTNLAFEWRVYHKAETEMRSIVSLSTTDKTKFVLNSYGLLANTWYSFKYRVFDTTTGIFNDAYAFVNLLPGKLVPIISGGKELSIRMGTSQIVDASGSFDENSRSLAGISFTWSCLQLEPVYSTSCPLVLAPQHGGSQLLVQAISVRNVSISKLTLTLADANRTASASVLVRTTLPAAPLVSMSKYQNPVLSSNPLYLEAKVNVGSTCTGGWSVNSSSINLATTALSPTSRSFSSASNFYEKVYLSLPPNVLQNGVYYLFSFRCAFSTSSVVVQVNQAPQYGDLTVVPGTGTELSTVYTFSAARWFDDDTPLSYQFGYSNAQGFNLVAKSLSEQSFTRTLLSTSNATFSYRVFCYLTVYDFYGASSSSTVLVTVNPAPVPVSSEVLIGILTTGGGNVDDSKKAIAVVSSTMSTKTCSGAPNCVALNRRQCSSVTNRNTCGSCSVGFVGEVGSSNSLCVSNVTTLSTPVYSVNKSTGSRTQLCNTTSQCAIFGVCDTLRSTCFTAPKACANNCSGNGLCSYVSIATGDVVTKCLSNDPSCKPKCICDQGFGGSQCDRDESELLSAQHVAGQVSSLLYSVSKKEYQTSTAINSWVAMVPTIVSTGDLLTTDSATDVLKVIDIATSGATALKMPPADLEPLLDSMSKIVELMSAGSLIQLNESDYNGRRLVSSLTLTDSKDLSLAEMRNVTTSILDSFLGLVSQSQVPNQQSYTSIHDSFRIKSETFGTTTDAYSVKIDMPLTDYEESARYLKSGLFVTIPPSYVAQYSNSSFATDVLLGTSSESSIGIVQSSVSQYGGKRSGITSNPMRIVSSNLAFEDGYTLVFQNNDEVNYPVVNTNYTYVTKCFDGVPSFHTYYCYDGFNITHICNGTAGTHITDCPAQIFQPKCYPVNGINLTEDFNVCSLVSYSNFNTTCSCDIKNFSNSNLDLEPNSPVTIAIEYATVKIYLASEFYNDFTPYISPPVYTMISFLVAVCFSIIMCGGFHFYQFHYDCSLLGDRKQESTKDLEEAKTAEEVDSDENIWQFINEALPAVYSMKCRHDAMIAEIYAHHRYWKLLEKDSKKKTKFLSAARATLNLTTIVSLNLFLVVLWYFFLILPNDGTCSSKLSKDDCLFERSLLDNSIEYCRWHDAHEYSDTSYCYYREPVIYWKPIFIILLIVGVSTSGIHVFVDYLLNILFADDAKVSANYNDPDLASDIVEGQSIKNKGRGRARQTVIFATSAATRKDTFDSRLIQNASLSLGAKVPLKKQAVSSRDMLAKQSTKVKGVVQANRDSSAATKGAFDSMLKAQSDVWLNPPYYAQPAPKLSRGMFSPVRLSMLMNREQGTSRSIFFFVENCLNLVGLSSSVRDRVKSVMSNPDTTESGHGYEALLHDIQAQLNTHMSSKDAENFKDDWMIVDCDEEGGAQFAFKSEALMRDVRSDANKTDSMGEEKWLQINSYIATETEIGAILLYSFIQDLLGRDTFVARMFWAKLWHDFRPRYSTRQARIIAGVTIATVNICCIVGIAIMVTGRSYNWQIACLLGTILQLGIELSLAELSVVALLHYFIPNLARQQVNSALGVVHDTLKKMHDIEGGVSAKGSALCLDSPSHLFHSRILANHYEHLFESSLIQFYTTISPGAMGQKWRKELNVATTLWGHIQFYVVYVKWYLTPTNFLLFITSLPVEWQLVITHGLFYAIVASFGFLIIEGSEDPVIFAIVMPILLLLGFLASGGFSKYILPSLVVAQLICSRYLLFFYEQIKIGVMPDLEEELSEELSAEGSQKSFNKEESSSTGSVESVGQFLFQLEDVVVEESDEEKEGEVAPLPEQGGIGTGNNDRLSLRSFSSQASSNMMRRTRVPSITIRRTSVATGGPAGAAGRRQSTSGRRKRTSSASSSDEEENAGRRMSQVAGRRGSTLGSRRRSSAIKPNFEVSFNRPAAPAAAPFGLDDVDNDVDILISSSDESEYSDSASEVDDFDSAGDPECSDESIESDDSSNESFDMKIRNMASPKAKPSLVRAAQTVSRVLGVFKSPKMSYSLKDEMSPKPVPENKTRLLKKNMEATGEEQDRFENVLDMLGANADEEAAIPTRKKVFASRVPRGGAAQESAGDEFAANADPTGLFDGVLNEGDREQDDDLFDRHLLRKETAPKTPEGRFAVNPSGDSNECDYEDEGSGSIGGLNSRDLDSIAEESLHGGGSFYSQVGAAADISGQVSQLIANSSIISAPSDDKDSPPLDDEKSSPSDDEIAMPSDDEDDEYSCDSEPKSGISAESSHEVQSGRLELDTPDNLSSAGGIGIAEHASNSASADLVEEERSDVHDDHNEHDGLDAHDDYDGRNDHDDHNAEVDAEPTEGAAGSSTGRRGRFSRWDDLDAAIDLSSDEEAEPWRQEEESVSDDPSASEGDADDDSSLGQFDLGD